MKKINLFAIIGLFTLSFTACNEQGLSSDPYTKKHLIEEFTSQDCIYCPYGMDIVHEFIGDDKNWILVLHHAGFSVDNFTVSGSRIISSALGVSGAPSMTVDRTITKTVDGNQLVFHPAYLSADFNRAQYDAKTYASLKLNNTYNASTRTVQVRISGTLNTDDHPSLYLTVLLKESGMVDYQGDYRESSRGWTEFRHTNAVRAYMSTPKGDEVMVNNNYYSAVYTLTLDEKWVPENCMVVAFLSEEFKPVVQAEQAPVVPGSKGGADILYGGITTAGK